MICLLPHCGYLSETTRALALYAALRKRGAAVRVATHGGPHETLLRDAAVPYDLVGPRMAESRYAELLRAEVGIGAHDQSVYTDEELRAYAVAEAEYFRAHRVRAAVIGFTLTAHLSTGLVGIPLVTDHGSWVPPVFERGLLPLPSAPDSAVFRLLPGPLARRLWNRGAGRTRRYCAGLNRVAAELGIPGVPSLAALVLGDLALVTEVPEVLGIPAAEMLAWDPAGRPSYRPGTRLRYCGPIYSRLDLPLPGRVADFLDGPGPIVYVAITSSAPELVRRVVTALGALDLRVLVAATVHDLDDLASDRVMVAGVLPSQLVMPRVDLAVTAGGQGSVQTAMASGTPVLGIPLQPEQDLNVVLLERLGAARRLALRHAGGHRLAELARQMLADDRYRLAAQRVQRWYDTVDGPGNAADIILSMVEA